MKKSTALKIGSVALALTLAAGGTATRVYLHSQKSSTQLASESGQKKVEKQEKNITIHYFWALNDEPRVYYTQADDNKVAMEEQGVPMESEGNNWYVYTIPSTQLASVQFKVGSYDYVTAAEKFEAGEYWVEETATHDEAPASYTNVFKEEQTEHAGAKGSKTTVSEGEEVVSDANMLATNSFDKIVKAQAVTNTADGITIHYPSDWNSVQLYAWNALPKDVTNFNWPGEALVESDGYYTYTFDGLSKVNFLFHNGAEQSDEFTIKKAGEYWYSNGKWVTKKPSDNSGSGTVVKPPQQATTGEKLGGDFREDSIYFLITTRFYDGDSGNNVYCWDGKGNKENNDPEWRGDFKGLIEKLDYIKALGFSAIWITPVVENASGYDYHGYHAYDFSKVDSRYESSDITYQTLIDACHKKGIKVVQDIVLNHTGNWGEANLYHMFDKAEETTDADGYPMSGMMEVGGDKVDQLNAGAKVKGATDYADAIVKKKEYDARIAAMKEDKIDTDNIYHHFPNLNWDDYTCQLGQIAGDCVDLNTENPLVYNYLIDCYDKYINMGVDAFRVDTVKHVSRLTFNKTFLPAFKKAGGDDFFMFGEVCARFGGGTVWYREQAPISCPFYTWAEKDNIAWSEDPSDWESNYNAAVAHYANNLSCDNQPTSDNAFLNGNDYHETDYSLNSGMSVIDFPMHWNFSDVGTAIEYAKNGDKYYNDATWNVVYVDSHDYGPDFCQDTRYTGGEEAWAENMCLMFTFRGIPCVFYGSEVEFKKDVPIDVGNTAPIEKTGRAYYGDYLEGEVTASDFGEYTASGTVEATLASPLSQQLIRLNKIRRAIPALQKGQYSMADVSGSGYSYRRRFTDSDVDSYALVNLSGSATFKNVENGEYIEVVTGKKVNVTDGTLTTEKVSKGNLRVYVLNNDSCTVSGKIGTDGTYIK